MKKLRKIAFLIMWSRIFFSLPSATRKASAPLKVLRSRGSDMPQVISPQQMALHLVLVKLRSVSISFCVARRQILLAVSVRAKKVVSRGLSRAE